MSYFFYSNGELFCEKININEIAQKVKTPFYLYSKNGLINNFKLIDRAFSEVNHTICFALKANSNMRLLKTLVRLGCGADVVSGGELFFALKAGFSPSKIVYAGVGKTDDEIQYAIETGIAAINVESEQELDVIHQIAKKVNQSANIAIRVNPDIDVHGHPYISTGKALNKFGIDIEKALDVYERTMNMPFIRPVGVHNHIGSMIFDLEFFRASAEKLKTFVNELNSIGIHIEHVDIGGGLGVQYEHPITRHIHGELVQVKASPDPGELGDKILPILKSLGCEIFFEPGRSMVANIGILVTKVLFTKESRGKKFIVVDTGMNHLIRPCLYGAYHEIVPLIESDGRFELADVVGPICESSDFLAQNRPMPAVDRGDLLAVMTAGAYGFTLASNYNAHPRPAEILVDGDTYHIVRERERYEDLLA